MERAQVEQMFGWMETMDKFPLKTIAVVTLIALCPAGAPAEPSTDWAKVHDLTILGIHRLYNLEIDSAMQAFKSVTRMAPGDPRGPFFQSIIHFYLYGLNRDEKELSTFLDESDKVVDICDRLLDENGGDTQTKFYLGGIYGYRGLAYQASGSILKAVRDGRKGYLLLEEAVNENPKLYDAQMGFGLFRYLLAKLPNSMRWILSMLGFSGDLEGGLNSLRLAAEKGTYTRTEAKLYLAQFLFAEGHPDSAVKYLNELRAEYPENTLFLVLYAFWEHRLHNLDEAMKAARAAIELNNRRKVHYGEELAYSTLGSIYFTLNDFPEARTYYRLYMRMTHNDDRTPAFTFLRAGLACEIAGDRATAVEFYRRMKEPDERDRSWDTPNYRRGQELLKHPITEAEVLVTMAANESVQNHPDSAVTLYREGLVKSGSNPDLEARAMYGILQVNFDRDSLASVLETAQRLVSLKPVNETWVLPHTWFKLGQTYAKLGKITDARAALERVGDYDDYDFQERLEKQVKTELERLDQTN